MCSPASRSLDASARPVLDVGVLMTMDIDPSGNPLLPCVTICSYVRIDDGYHAINPKNNYPRPLTVVRLKNRDIEFPPLRQHCVTKLAIVDGSCHHHCSRHSREQQPRLAAPFLLVRTRHVLRYPVCTFVEGLRKCRTHSLRLPRNLSG
jgi:hypothetical protein